MSFVTSKRTRWLGGSLLALGFALNINVADAQSAAAAAPPPPPPPVPSNLTPITGLKPVVITARHRAERVQSVPVAVTVIGLPAVGTGAVPSPRLMTPVPLM